MNGWLGSGHEAALDPWGDLHPYTLTPPIRPSKPLFPFTVRTYKPSLSRIAEPGRGLYPLFNPWPRPRPEATPTTVSLFSEAAIHQMAFSTKTKFQVQYKTIRRIK